MVTEKKVSDLETKVSINEEDIEEQLLKLRATYMDMKKERVKAENDTKLFENKLKMLETEEKKMFKKFSKEKKFKEEWEQARQKIIDFKKELNEAKIKRSQEQFDNGKKIKAMREQIQKNLENSKLIQLQENKLNSLQLKQKKIEGTEQRINQIREESERNKKIADATKKNEKNLVEKKKQTDLEKKMKLKMELEQKLLEEQSKKVAFDTRLKNLEDEEIGFLKRMKYTLNDEENKESRMRSLSTGPGKSDKASNKLNNSMSAKKGEKL